MKNISRDGYSTEEIWDALRGVIGSRNIDFRYDLLDENENKINELYDIESASVEMSAFSTIKRTASFSLREEQMMDTTRTPRKLISYEGIKIGEL